MLSFGRRETKEARVRKAKERAKARKARRAKTRLVSSWKKKRRTLG